MSALTAITREQRFAVLAATIQKKLSGDNEESPPAERNDLESSLGGYPRQKQNSMTDAHLHDMHAMPKIRRPTSVKRERKIARMIHRRNSSHDDSRHFRQL